jgi:hypothetical protein
MAKPRGGAKSTRTGTNDDSVNPLISHRFLPKASG